MIFHRRAPLGAAALFALAACAFAGPARADQPYAFDKTFGRLPKTVVPLAYDIALTPDIPGRTTSGHEVVRVRVRTATKVVVFNTLEMSVKRASLGAAAGVPAISTDEKAQQTTLRFAHAIAPGTYDLTLDFAGKIGTQPEGLFVVPYTTASGGKEEMLATQFESTDARRMFPGWDEPADRATYRLTVTVPADFEAVSNMPVARERAAGQLKTVTFERTPKMSSYLVVFCAGRFASIADSVDGVKLRVVAPRDRIDNARYALDAEKKLLAYYDTYYGYHYPLPKLDLIDVPGGFPGAMENWGGITFNESLLLFDPKIEPESSKEEIFQTVAHEMSHQWTGDLVTMDWWSGIWLNESFADWMQTKATDHFNPQWHLWDRVEGDVEAAMGSDQQSTAHPIEKPVQDESQAAAAFDEITYQKGGAVIRMLEQYLGEDTFRDGVRAYIRDHAYSNSTAADLWNGLDSAAHRDVGAIASAFIEQPGVPLVTAEATCADGRRTLALSQQRFLIEPGEHAAQTWTIPVGIAVDGKTTYTLLGAAPARVDGGPCDKPFAANAGALGYYRVRLDPASTAAQIARLGDLSVAERARFIGDTNASVLAGALPASQLIGAIGAVRPDDALAVWSSVNAALTGMGDLEAGQSGQPAFDAYRVRLLSPLLARVGWDAKPGEDPQTADLRSGLIYSLGVSGDRDVIAEAQARFTKFVADPASLAPALREPVLTIAGSYADEATWEQLHALFVKSTSPVEGRQLAQAMWSARDPQLAAKNLAMATQLPPQLGGEMGYIDVVYVALGGRHPDVAWSYFKAHSDELAAKISGFMRPLVIPIIAPLFWSTAPEAELDAFIDSAANLPPEQAARAKHRIDVRLKQRAQLLPAIDAAVHA
jgi:aminopeptidase N